MYLKKNRKLLQENNLHSTTCCKLREECVVLLSPDVLLVPPAGVGPVIQPHAHRGGRHRRLLWQLVQDRDMVSHLEVIRDKVRVIIIRRALKSPLMLLMKLLDIFKARSSCVLVIMAMAPDSNKDSSSSVSFLSLRFLFIRSSFSSGGME